MEIIMIEIGWTVGKGQKISFALSEFQTDPLLILKLTNFSKVAPRLPPD